MIVSLYNIRKDLSVTNDAETLQKPQICERIIYVNGQFCSVRSHHSSSLIISRAGIIAHEFGHVAGIAHSTSITQSSLMTTYYTDSLWSNSPTTYDINILNNLY
ncbi:matrixin family metalloprotease [Cohnella phaseoli]|uniref:matrixin family metalloprotease n=1 Tax=Cohnella phaseoli TaxID=456490 RepID=UPI000E286BD9